MSNKSNYPTITQENLREPAFVARLQEWVRRDDCVNVILPSDLRLLVGALADYVLAEQVNISVADPNEEPTQRSVPTITVSDTFQKELERLINKHSKENGSNTPDFILAQYLTDCLAMFNKTMQRRDLWYRG